MLALTKVQLADGKQGKEEEKKRVILWVDDSPENNKKEVTNAVEKYDLSFQQKISTKEAQLYMQSNIQFNSCIPDSFRIITDSFRPDEGDAAAINLIKWVRSTYVNETTKESLLIPILIYCSNLLNVIQLQSQFPFILAATTTTQLDLFFFSMTIPLSSPSLSTSSSSSFISNAPPSLSNLVNSNNIGTSSSVVSSIPSSPSNSLQRQVSNVEPTQLLSNSQEQAIHTIPPDTDDFRSNVNSNSSVVSTSTTADNIANSSSVTITRSDTISTGSQNRTEVKQEKESSKGKVEEENGEDILLEKNWRIGNVMKENGKEALVENRKIECKPKSKIKFGVLNSLLPASSSNLSSIKKNIIDSIEHGSLIISLSSPDISSSISFEKRINILDFIHSLFPPSAPSVKSKMKKSQSIFLAPSTIRSNGLDYHGSIINIDAPESKGIYTLHSKLHFTISRDKTCFNHSFSLPDLSIEVFAGISKHINIGKYL